MFTMTPTARSVARRVTSHRALSKRSGLRIAVAGSEDAPIQVRAAEGPRADDEVVEREGARLFIGPGTWERLAGRTIDAVTERTGRIQFVLRAR